MASGVKSNVRKFGLEIRRMLAGGVRAASRRHAGIYRHLVSEHVGVRPLPPFWSYRGRPVGHPYRSLPGEYPYIDPGTEARPHGFEQIRHAVQVRENTVVGRSGLLVGGIHLFELSHGSENPYGKRLGMDQAFMDNVEQIRVAFKEGALV